MERFDIDRVRAEFPILQQKIYGKPLVYLDSGATSQKPLAVINCVHRLMSEQNANIHRGLHYMSEKTTQEYENAREVVRKFIGAKESAEVIFTSGATAGINCVAYSFGGTFINEGDNVVISEMEHHSNIVPWQLICERKGANIRVLPFDDSGALELDKLDGLIDNRTRMVAVTQASNVLGTRPNLKRIVEIAHSKGVPVLVDGCQGIVHGRVDVTELDCDFYVFSGHKLYAPNGIGVLYGKREWLEKMPPFMGGGDMVATVSFEKTTYAELPLRFEAGTSNYVGAIALAEAIKFVSQFDALEVEAHEHSLLEYANQRLLEIDGLKLYGTTPDKCSIVAFLIDGVHSMDLGMIVDKFGIAIRTGTHCAQPIMSHYGITGMSRASFAMYNTIEEIDVLGSAIERAVSMLR